MSALRCQVETLSEVLARIEEKIDQVPVRELILTGAVKRSLRPRDEEPLASSSYRPAKAESIEIYLDKLRQLEPRAFPLWKQLFERAADAYRHEPGSSCSHQGNLYAEAFCGFLSLHARGRILDVGCGIRGRPSYLREISASRISGLEPLEPIEKPPFELVRGVAEFMPWPDGSFDTVVSATSLDHVLSLEKTLSEVQRVLVPRGRFIVWIGSVPGAEPFDPLSENLAPIDDFHLFHFDADWFEDLVRSRFCMQKRYVFPTLSFDHVFYCLESRS